MTSGKKSRRTGATVVAVILLAIVVAYLWLASEGRIPSPLSATTPGASAPASNPGDQPSAANDGTPARPDDAIALTVTYVFDGDTIEARAATPNDLVPSTEPFRVRLIGIDTPEGTPTAECWADEARAHLARLLPEGSTVWAAPDTEPRDRYDRALFYLWTDDGRFVNYELVAAGDAVTLRIAPNTAHARLLSDAEGRAAASGAGQWGACD